MSNSKAHSPIRTADYEAIETALLQSARGRWFLAEYSKRNRSADTRMLLDAITKLETNMLQPGRDAKNAHLQRDLNEMAEAISKTREEIAAIRSADQQDCQFTTATEELDAIVEATEKATSNILEAAEDVQEIAWLLREKGVEDQACDRLDARATDIYTACSFQDLTGQRTGKVVQTLRFLENRVLAMIEIWGLDDIEVRNISPDTDNPDSHLLNGPSRKGEGMDQAGIDQMIDASTPQGPVIEGEAAGQAEQSARRAEPMPPAQPPAAPVQPQLQTQTPPQTVAGEVEAKDFSAPPALDVGKLDEIKKQALFS